MKKSKKIGLIFDFDDTLCPDSTNGFLQWLGIETETFWSESKLLMNKGFDPMLAYMNLMIQKSKQRKFKNLFCKENFNDYGETIQFFPGVKSFFGKIRKFVAGLNNNASVHFFLISSGIDQIICSSKIVKEFDGIFTSAFLHDDKTGNIKLPKRVVSFTDKTRFLFAISKGLSPEEYFSNPFLVNTKIKPKIYPIPFNQMIFTGDGFSDIPCFALLKAYKGYGIGVYKKHHIHTALSLVEDERVTGIAKVNYSENGFFIKTIKKHILNILNNN